MQFTFVSNKKEYDTCPLTRGHDGDVSLFVNVATVDFELIAMYV